MRAAPLLVLVALAIGGCGDDSDDEPSPADEAAVLRTIEKASETFAAGEYSRTCSYYSVDIQRELAAESGSCPKAWAEINKALRQSLSPSQFEALTGYGAESAEIDGDLATATFGEPPKSIGHLFTAGTTMDLRKVDGRWVITSLPQSTAPAREV